MTLPHTNTVPSMDRFVETNGIRLHVVEHAGDGPPLVLMPGLTGNARFFDAVVAEGLAPAFTVLALDLRGRGRSDKPATGYTMADHAADVLGLLDALGLERVVLGGHSFGGLLACLVATTVPERVERCLILDAPLFTARPSQHRVVEQLGPTLARLDQETSSWEEYLASIKAQPYYDGWWDPRIEAYYRADVETLPSGAVRPRSSSAIIGQCMDGARAVDWTARASQLTQPTLFVRTTDPYGPPGYPPLLTREQAKRATSGIADCTLVDAPGNHMTGFYGDGAAVVASAIRSFLG